MRYATIEWRHITGILICNFRLTQSNCNVPATFCKVTALRNHRENTSVDSNLSHQLQSKGSCWRPCIFFCLCNFSALPSIHQRPPWECFVNPASLQKKVSFTNLTVCRSGRWIGRCPSIPPSVNVNLFYSPEIIPDQC